MDIALRSYVNIDIQKEDRKYVLAIPMGSPYSEAEEVALNMVEAVREMARRAQERADQEKAEKESDGQANS